MTTQLAPNRTDLPPPRTFTPSDAGSVVGWVSHDTIGFGGFANEEEAMAAAWMAHRTLSRQRARRDGTRPIPIDVEPLALARDGGREAILASGRSIATLIRPGDDSRSGPDAYGFEVQVPAQRDAACVRATAFLLYRTLRRSGIRWALWRADDRADARPDVRDASDDSLATPARRPAPHELHQEAASAGAGASEPSPRDDYTDARGFSRRIVGAIALPAIVAVAVLLPLLTTSVIVSVLGGIAALVAVVALAALVRLVVTDLWSDMRQALGRRTRGAARRGVRRRAGRTTGRHRPEPHRSAEA